MATLLSACQPFNVPVIHRIVRAVVRSSLPLEVTPELPPKKLRLGASKFAPDFVESRRVGLEAYLVHLVAAVEPERIEALDDFLEYAEHCLERAIAVLGGVTELTHVVRMLKSAADRAAAVHSKSQGGGGGGGGSGKLASAGVGPGGSARRQSDAHSEVGDEEDGDGDAPAVSTAAVKAPTAGGGGGELLPTLREVVRMMIEYASILRSGCEDAEEKGDATSASNSHLASRLHAKEEETVDLRQLMAALREKRRAECDRERAAMLLAAAQSRTVVAELRRVLREQSLFRAAALAHRASSLRLRGGDVSNWERGALAPAFGLIDAAAASSPLPVSLPPELASQASFLRSASGASAAMHEALLPWVATLLPLRQAPLQHHDDQLFSGSGAAAAGEGGGAMDSGAAQTASLLTPISPWRLFIGGAGSGGGASPDRDSGDDASSVEAAPPSHPPPTPPDGLAVMAAGSMLSGGNLLVAVALASAAAENAHLARLVYKLQARAFVRRPRPAVAAAAAVAAAQQQQHQPQHNQQLSAPAPASPPSGNGATVPASPAPPAATSVPPRVGLNPNFMKLGGGGQQQQQHQQPIRGAGGASGWGNGGGGGGHSGGYDYHHPAPPLSTPSASMGGSEGGYDDEPTPSTPAPSYAAASAGGGGGGGAPPASAAALMMRSKLAAATKEKGAGGNPFGGGNSSGVARSTNPF